MPQIFNLPDVGEGLTEAEILAWRVAPGETVKVNQVLVEIETAKSVVELPSPYAGTVLDLMVPEGRTVEVGTPIIAVGSPEEASGTGPAPEGTPGILGETRVPAETRPAPDADGDRPRVGSGPKADPVRRRRRIAPEPASPSVSEPARPADPSHHRWGGSAAVPGGRPGASGRVRGSARPLPRPRRHGVPRRCP